MATSNNISPLPLTASPPSGTVSDPWAVITYLISTTQYWFEERFAAGTNPQINLTYTNYGSEALTGTGYFISPTLNPLDQLNYTDEPPPGAANSPFTPLPGLDQNISGTGSLNFTIPLHIPSPPAVHQLRKRRRGDAI